MANLGTRIYTRFKGRLVGKDADGRCYYEARTANRTGGGLKRHERWVIYHKGEDASAVPPEWWGWLHHIDDAPLPESARKSWQIPYQPNQTGTPEAYRPPGSDYRGGQRASTTSDYEAWFPEG
ncbi:NADH:ubiquinone oxidoreductase subunit NDUFA12 [Novacetimonas pomaceti]|uniref:NADH-quinone oxidoreductase subunit D n=2 Tax=Novacetimonas TaxID=2919364 RepID=A0A318QC50_9PROT|nr:NADH:ubiquinone oxidoreductase subunit NDUFA12 [Novacetimonas pomaceti]MBV1834992.1 NADH:ubiquinone oxidoreductase subunit NDUFA12 [Novacetimonas pomaceti]PYD47026.1 NADH:ubiquinone oxidoreductase subunit NDUFA12 [Novacetimonas pomaceti]PYD76140.1 NADH-quinone oxidoreductase subunit D [Novacetimonas pomaceti]RBM08006.1 NADH:ubiquinone oxidoreductase subunit NDUFA12 [Novacetimonas cocois]